MRFLPSPSDQRPTVARWLGASVVAFGLGVGVGAGALPPVGTLVAGLRAPAAETPIAAAGATIADAVETVAETVATASTPAPVAVATAVPVAARERATGAESASALESAPPPEDTPAAAEEERYAFLLLGYGGGRHEGGYLTDSLMLVIVDPVGPRLTMLSIPRDTWVPMSFDGKSTLYNKVNTAYAFARDASLHPDRLPRYRGDEGAGVFAAETVSRLLGVPIRYHAALDFAGFRRAIDALGGVQVDVPTAFAARYPANDDPTIDPSWITVRFRAGPQLMNGETAIRYARARDALDDSGEGGDFARARRQRLIMEAFKSRLFEPTGLLQLPRLLKIGTEHLETDYDLPGAAQLGELLLDWRSVEIHQAALTLDNYLDEGTGADGAYLLVPRLEDRSWAQVRALARRLWADPALGAAMARTPVTVVNSTGTAGVGGQVAETLARMGYRVEPPVTGTPRDASRLIDRTGGEARVLARALAKDLGAEIDVVAGDDEDGQGLVLEIGRDGVDLARLAPPRDAGAPSSKVGVRTFGQWVPEADEPAATAVPATRRPAGTPRPGATGAAGTGTPPPSGTGRTGSATAGATPGSGTPTRGTATPAPAGAHASGTPAASTPSAAESPIVGSPSPAGSPAGGTPSPAARTPASTSTPRASATTPRPGGGQASATPRSTATGPAAPTSRTPTPVGARSATATPATSRTAAPAASPTRVATATPRAATASTPAASLTPTVTPAQPRTAGP